MAPRTATPGNVNRYIESRIGSFEFVTIIPVNKTGNDWQIIVLLTRHILVIGISSPSVDLWSAVG